MDEDGSPATIWSHAVSERVHLSTPDKVQYMDVSAQTDRIGRGFAIPFLEHDDANRALMLQHATSGGADPAAPTGRGRYRHGARRAIVPASWWSRVVRAWSIPWTPAASWLRCEERRLGGPSPGCIYNLTKYTRSNQNTCIKPEAPGETGRSHRGGRRGRTGRDDLGYLALGPKRIGRLHAMERLQLRGSIVISERVVEEDRFTKLHIES